MLPAATTATAVYNADNQLTSWNGTTIAYDLNGNLTSDGTRSFTWDARNRLTGITGVASFVYDGVGRRQSATQGATTTTALYDGYDPVQEQVPTGTVSANLQIGLGTDQRFTRTKGGVTSTYLTDLLGSTVALADTSGVVQTRYGYDPYGVTSQTGAANDNPYQFTGRQNDNTGLYYYRARYYNPVWGRFISEDPIGLAGGINQYAYVQGNPIGMIDPNGLHCLDVPQVMGNGICSMNPMLEGGGLAGHLSAGGGGSTSISGGGIGGGGGSPKGQACRPGDAPSGGIQGMLESIGGGAPRSVPTAKGATQFIFPNGTVLRFDLKPGQYLSGQNPHINLQNVPGASNPNYHIDLK